MIGTAIIYTPDQELVADDMFCPRVQGVTVEQAAAMCAEHLVMWTAGIDRFGYGLHVPPPDARFFLRGVEIVNPWAAFKPLDPYPVREMPGDRPRVQEMVEPEPEVITEIDEDAARLFGAADD